MVANNLREMWAQPALFGEENGYFDMYLKLIADRFALTQGFHMLRDELALGFSRAADEDFAPYTCIHNITEPTCMPTLCRTSCGDRVCFADADKVYESAVAGRFGFFNEYGQPKVELFSPTGGGTDSAATLAHVTVAHHTDGSIREAIYAGNSHSFVLSQLDLTTHCGRFDLSLGESIIDRNREFVGKPIQNAFYGKCRESVFREPRAACGAIVGAIGGYNPANPVHVRIRNDLGEDNFHFLQSNDVMADDGSVVTYLVAAALVSISGMRETLKAMAAGELDERGCAHATAAVLINGETQIDRLVYLARGTVFQGVIQYQGLGMDARRYSATMTRTMEGKKMVKLFYDHADRFPVTTIRKAPDEVEAVEQYTESFQYKEPEASLREEVYDEPAPASPNTPASARKSLARESVSRLSTPQSGFRGESLGRQSLGRQSLGRRLSQGEYEAEMM